MKEEGKIALMICKFTLMLSSHEFLFQIKRTFLNFVDESCDITKNTVAEGIDGLRKTGMYQYNYFLLFTPVYFPKLY